MSRATSREIKPSADWANSFETLSNMTLYLVSRQGPTVFALKDEVDNLFKVVLGNPHQCSCKSNKNFCVHLMYCLIKVLKVSKTHPLCYQSSLTDPEINQVLNGSCSNSSGVSIPPVTRRLSERKLISYDKVDSINLQNQNQYVTRQELDQNNQETCSICQDNMQSEQILTWCRTGCGNNFHAKCMKKFAQYKISNDLKPDCPLCREDWNMELLQNDCVENYSQNRIKCIRIHCNNCKCRVQKDFFRCLECSNNAYKKQSSTVDLCKDCFYRSLLSNHKDHHFLNSDASIEYTNEAFWIPCNNPNQTKPHIESSIIQDIQNRELNSNDFELLSNLHQEKLPSLPENLILSLSIVTKNIHHKQLCWCGQHALITESHPFISKLNGDVLLCLPCDHHAHVNCIMSDLTHLIENDEGQLAINLLKYKCKHVDCNQKIFPSLSRTKPRKPKPIQELNDKSSSTLDRKPLKVFAPSKQSPIQSMMGIEINGTSLKSTTNKSDSVMAPLHSRSSDRGVLVRPTIHRKLSSKGININHSQVLSLPITGLSAHRNGNANQTARTDMTASSSNESMTVQSSSRSEKHHDNSPLHTVHTRTTGLHKKRAPSEIKSSLLHHRNEGIAYQENVNRRIEFDPPSPISHVSTELPDRHELKRERSSSSIDKDTLFLQLIASNNGVKLPSIRSNKSIRNPFLDQKVRKNFHALSTGLQNAIVSESSRMASHSESSELIVNEIRGLDIHGQSTTVRGHNSVRTVRHDHNNNRDLDMTLNENTIDHRGRYIPKYSIEQNPRRKISTQRKKLLLTNHLAMSSDDNLSGNITLPPIISTTTRQK